jgi:predicted alpha/beta hydrolase family esterase
MKNALILHGTSNNSQGNWFQWLAKELRILGYEVWVPDLPDADKPDIEKYRNVVKDFNFNKETIIIGHSSGATAILGILNKLKETEKIKLAVLVSGFLEDKGWGCENIISNDLDWNKINKQAENFKIIWSNDDPYISEEQTKNLSEKLNKEITMIPNCGHFNLEYSENFKSFPQLLEIIKQIVLK